MFFKNKYNIYYKKVSMDKNKELSFEESLKELENIVDQLESGDIDLEKSVKLYEKGMLLKK